MVVIFTPQDANKQREVSSSRDGDARGESRLSSCACHMKGISLTMNLKISQLHLQAVYLSANKLMHSTEVIKAVF